MKYASCAVVVFCLALIGSSVAGDTANMSISNEKTPYLSAAGLEKFIGEKNAGILVESISDVFRYYSFGSIGPRYSSPSSVSTRLQELAGGQCEVTVEALRRIVADNGADLEIENVNLIVPYGEQVDAPLGGHTIGGIRTENGTILLDTTFGLVFVLEARTISDSLFDDGAVSVFRVGDSPEGYYNSLSVANNYYINVNSERASFAENGSGRLTAKSPIIDLSSDKQFGKFDGLSTDVNQLFGSYLDHLGSHFTRTEHVWRFRGQKKEWYKLTFTFTKATTSPLALTASVVDDGGKTVFSTSAIVPNEFPRWTVIFVSPSESFEVRISSEKFGGRFIDAVEIYNIDSKVSDGGMILY